MLNLYRGSAILIVNDHSGGKEDIPPRWVSSGTGGQRSGGMKFTTMKVLFSRSILINRSGSRINMSPQNSSRRVEEEGLYVVTMALAARKP
jgi:hypothetical protein